jgi:hypothetical protein
VFRLHLSVSETAAVILAQQFRKPQVPRVAIAGIPHERNDYAESAGAVNGAGDVHFVLELITSAALGHGDLLAVAERTGLPSCYLGNLVLHFHEAPLATCSILIP